MTDASTLQAQGVKLYEQQDYEAAAKVFKQAREAYEAVGQSDMAAEMQTNIGLVHRALGEHQQALDVMQAALRSFQDSDDRLRSAQVLGNMGGVYLEMGDKEQAYNCYRQAADVFLELDEKVMYGETLLAMAKVQFKDGKIWPAAATYEVGLDYLPKLTFSQRVLKGLISFRNRISGGGVPKADNEQKEESSETPS